MNCADCGTPMERHDGFWWHPHDECPVIVYDEKFGYFRDGDTLDCATPEGGK